jgi:putative addiction module CopG family antidote
MSVRLPKDAEERVLHLVESGRYRDSGTAMREAVNLLEERDRRLTWLRRDAVANADAALDRGEGIPYSHELLDDLETHSEVRFHRGPHSGRDVLP